LKQIHQISSKSLLPGISMTTEKVLFLHVILNDSEESRWLNPDIKALKEILCRLQLLRMTFMVLFQ